jgi:prephenate dehydrogenase
MQIKLGILGVGLIGGSFALALKKALFASKVYGVDHQEKNLTLAKELGIIDDFGRLDEVLKQVDVMIIAIPVDATKKVLMEILNQVERQTIIDVGSTKSAICDAVKNHPKRMNFVAAHPIAGTENSGPSAAFDSLYQGKVNIICDSELSGEPHINLATELFQASGLKNLFMNSSDHDRHIAYVSHLSHISSFMLGKTVLEIEKDEKNIFNMAGSGFASTVRLAKSSPEMWTPIFMENKEALLTALRAYIDNLEAFEELLKRSDGETLFGMMKEANQIRKVLDKT